VREANRLVQGKLGKRQMAAYEVGDVRGIIEIKDRQIDL
jgi:hypothetical protein